MASTILRMENITKLFPGVKALDNVNIDVTEGEIHADRRRERRGKIHADERALRHLPLRLLYGRSILPGRDCASFRNIKDSERRGIAIIHQELALVPYLSIAENMYLGNEQEKAGVINWDLTNQQAAKYMGIVGLQGKPPHADQGHRHGQAAAGGNRQGADQRREAADSGRAHLVAQRKRREEAAGSAD